MKKIALFLILATVSLAAEEKKPEKQSEKSVYVPMCMETRGAKAKHPKNSVILTTGPSKLQVPGDQNETLFVFGYFREIREDLGLGFLLIGTNRQLLGPTVGLEYKFGP